MVIKFNLSKYRKLKQEFANAENEGKTSFSFEGRELKLPFTEMLLEYLKPQFE